MGDLFGGGGGDAPKPPPFTKLDINDIAERWISKDIDTYDFNDAQWAAQFPGLASGRIAMMDKVYKAITGPLDSTVQSKFVKDALGRTSASLGGGQADASASLVKGSLGRNATSADVARSTSAYRDVMSSELDSLLSANQPRVVGPGMGDIINMGLYNQSGGTQAANAAYQNALSMAMSDFSAQQAQYAALASSIGGISRAYTGYNMNYGYGT